MQIRAEVDHCRPRLMKYCQGQGLDLGCGQYKIRPDTIGIDLNGQGDMVMDARILNAYPDKFFDYIFSSHLLEEIPNTEATLKEWLRVIKDGGYIALYQVDQEYYPPIGHKDCNTRHVHHFSWEALWDIFKKIDENLTLVHHQRYAREPYNEWSFELVIQKRGQISAPVETEEAITILVPTLNRPKDVIIFAQSVEATTTKKNLVEIVFGVHAEDTASLQAIKELKSNISVRAEILEHYKDGKAHLAFLWNQLYRVTCAPIVGFFGDDVIFNTPGWDNQVREEFAKDKAIMVSCNDVHNHRGKTATLFFTHRALHDKVGYYLNENFRRWYVDTFWDEAFKIAGKMHYREDLMTEHLSPDVFKERADSTYKNMEGLKGQDRINWQSSNLQQEIQRVVAIIKKFK